MVHERDSGAPVVLVAYGWDNARVLEHSKLDGNFVMMWRQLGKVFHHDMFGASA